MVAFRPSPRHCLAAILSISLAAPVAAHTLDELQSELTEGEHYVQFVDKPTPEFILQDANGNVVSLASLSGKVVVLWFIYASCPDVCPLQSEALAAVQGMVNQTPMRDLVRFIAITTDPANDGPDVLASYGKAHGLDPANFAFLTSGTDAPDATRALGHRLISAHPDS
jgi:protein SCO1/2